LQRGIGYPDQSDPAIGTLGLLGSPQRDGRGKVLFADLAAVRFGCSDSVLGRGMTDVKGGKLTFNNVMSNNPDSLT
jgi:hypothetical protein